jgi:hypothetical protein
MPKVTVPYRDQQLEAEWSGEEWTVRLGEREVTSRYLDYALTELGLEAHAAHQVATRITEESPPEARES